MPISLLLPDRCVFCRKVAERGSVLLCGVCRNTLPWRTPPDRDGILAPFWYRGAVRSALHRFKFRGRTAYAAMFGSLMAETARGMDAGMVTWVPCSLLRRWTRGYDQSRLLARVVAKQLGLPAKPLLRRSRHTRSQTKMSGYAARQENVRGVFAARNVTTGSRVLLIDDIHTTGATARAARDALLAAGAGAVRICVAATR